MIKRELYLKKLRKFQDQPLIKVITGMRRAGKSTLLELFADMLRAQGVRQEQIIRMNFDLMAFDAIRDYRALYAYVKEHQASGKCYLLLDEVQQVATWEKAVNSLFTEGGYDIYLTGSNAYLLSSDLSTLLAGRYVEIQVFPLSFREYLDFLPDARREGIAAAFQQYLKYGGLPVVPQLPQTDDAVETLLSGIYNTVLMKDVIQRNAVRDPLLLEHIVRFLADSIGSPFSTKRMAGYLTSQGQKTSAATIDNYLKMLECAFIFYRAPRYDIKGKLHLKTQGKYYIVDNGLRNALLGFRGGDYGHILENIVYLELLRRGYRVTVGKLGSLEVDFIAERADRKIYVQVAYLLASEETIEREFGVYRQICDNYPKYVLSLDEFDMSRDGILHRNIRDFLLQEEI